MKKLIIKIGNETHELPYNGETFSFEVEEHYVPKVGDCVIVECRNTNKNSFYWFKVKEFINTMVDFSLAVGEDLTVTKEGFFNRDNSRIYTQITTEELKDKYAEAGYDWDCESDTIKPLKWMPKVGDYVKISFKKTGYEYYGKIRQIEQKKILLKSAVNEIFGVVLNVSLGYYYSDIVLTQSTHEELKAKYAKAGYNWDYERDTIKPLKWMPKPGDYAWYLNNLFKSWRLIFEGNGGFEKDLLDKGLLFQTEEECQKFADHCLKYFDKK